MYILININQKMKTIKAIRIYILSIWFSSANKIWFSTITPDKWSAISNWTDSIVEADANTILWTINIINWYLRLAIWAITLWVLIYWWFKLISSQWEEKKLKEANSLILWAFVGIVIASMWYAIIKIVVNLF